MRRLALIAAVVLAVTLPACGGGGDDAAPATATQPQPSVAPLTGLPDPGGDAATRAALWVKIGNQPPSQYDEGARPQSGLEVADVVYEEVAEGGVTRFAAVYNSVVPERAGPVRSVRVMDADLVQPLLGIFAYSGGAPGPTNLIEAVPALVTVDETRAAGESMIRTRDRGMPNNLYVLGPEMFAVGGDPKPPPPLFEFLEELEEGESFGGEPVESFVVGFGFEPVTYRWEPTRGVWLRFLGEQPFNTINGEQVTATNVIVQVTHYPNEAEGTTIGEGEAWVFSSGALIRGTWTRSDPGEPVRYLDAEGNEIKLTPGRTWIALLPDDRTVEVVTPPVAG